MNGSLPVRYTCAMIIITYIALNSLREVLQLYQQRWHYLLDPINLVSWLLYICSIIMIIPVFADQLTVLQLSCASITVFLSWFNLLLYLQRWVSILNGLKYKKIGFRSMRGSIKHNNCAWLHHTICFVLLTVINYYSYIGQCLQYIWCNTQVNCITV
jgi:hypothetical protein